MERHVAQLNSVCRLGAERLSSSSTGSKYPVRQHRESIKLVLGIDVGTDDPEIHPEFMCSLCERAIHRAYVRKVGLSGCGCGPMFEREPHKRQNCTFCSAAKAKSLGGRSKKKGKGGLQAVASSVPHSTSSTAALPQGTVSSIVKEQVEVDAAGMDIDLEQVEQLATPPHRATLELAPERFDQPFDDLMCAICLHVADRAVQSNCCTHLFCAPCICIRLASSASCPFCKDDMVASSLLAPNRIVCGVLGMCRLSCDFHVSTWVGCPARVALSELGKHVASCTHAPDSHQAPPCTVVMRSSTLGDVLTASPSKLQGSNLSMSDSTLAHLVKSQASGNSLEVRTGGRPQVWKRTPIPLVDSALASPTTLRRRSMLLKERQQLVCGSAVGASVQVAKQLKNLTSAERDDLLMQLGVKGSTPSPGTALALKADLHLPWHQLRKLQRWLVSFGVHFESERTTRKSIQNLPVVCIPDLVLFILRLLDMHKEANTLVWHDGIPADEIWVKFGGDHGGNSFKFCCQIVNVAHPNAAANTISISLFLDKDLPANLESALGIYRTQLKPFRKRLGFFFGGLSQP